MPRLCFRVSKSLFRPAATVTLLAAGFLGVAASAAAQGTGGVISGTISDAQGGALPGASLTLRNVETGTVRTAVNSASSYPGNARRARPGPRLRARSGAGQV